MVVFHALHSLLVRRVQSFLEVLVHPLLTELLLDSIDDGHDSLDVFIEELTLLKAFECDHGLVLVLLGNVFDNF